MCRLGTPTLSLPLAGLVLFAAGGLTTSCVVPVARAQDSGASGFEVASIKPSGPIDPRRVRMFEFIANEYPRGLFAVVGQRVEVHGKTAAQLVAAAYLIPTREIVGPPWISDFRFDVEALIPSGQSPDKASEMLRILLEERLALKAHREVRRMSGYILSIGKGGPKLTETGPPTPTKDSRNYVDRIKPGFNGDQMDHCDMACLKNDLARNLGAPIEDQTGLKGYYSILIQAPYSEMADEAARLGVFRDAMDAYGLHLAAGKVDAPVLVIDSISKTPTEN